MQDKHASTRFPVFGTEVEKLFNSRYRISVRCDVSNRDEDWYYANRSYFWKEFGDLYEANLDVDGVDDGWNPRDGETYPDMRLVRTEFGYLPTRTSPVLTFIYETLGDNFTQDVADKVDYELNGLRRVTRSVIAKDGAVYGKTVGTTTINHAEHGYGPLTLTLASAVEQAKSENEGGFVRIVETWIEPGILSLRTPKVGGQQQVVVQAIGLTSAQVNSQLSEVTADHELVDSTESDYEGFSTSTYTFELNDFDVWSETENGLKLLERTELDTSDFSALTVGDGPTSFTLKLAESYNLYVSGQEIDNGNTIKKRVSRWAEAGTLSESERTVNEGIIEVTKVFLGVEETFNGPVMSRRIEDFEGFRTITVSRYQKKDGTSIIDDTNPTFSYKTMVPFSYPGAVSLREETPLSYVKRFSLAFARVPTQTRVKGTVYTFFQTTADIANTDFVYATASGYYHPNNWASIEVEANDDDGTFGQQYFTTEGLRGYRCASTSKSGTISPTASSGVQFWWQGVRRVVDGSRIDYDIDINQGPPDPVGSKWVVEADVKLAFEDVDGNAYYKKTLVVTDAIPTQVSNTLPYDGD